MDINELPFGFRIPFSDRSTARVISIFGVLPGPDAEAYAQFDAFIWRLLEFTRNKHDDPIKLVIDSYGGDDFTLDILLDHISLISCPVYTVARNACSAAAYLLAAGAKEHRYVFRNSRVMLHNAQHSHNCPDPEHHAQDPALVESLAQMNHGLARRLLAATEGKILKILGEGWSNITDEEERITALLALLENNVWLNAQEAVEYGIADHIIDEESFQLLFFR